MRHFGVVVANGVMTLWISAGEDCTGKVGCGWVQPKSSVLGCDHCFVGYQSSSDTRYGQRNSTDFKFEERPVVLKSINAGYVEEEVVGWR